MLHLNAFYYHIKSTWSQSLSLDNKEQILLNYYLELKSSLWQNFKLMNFILIADDIIKLFNFSNCYHNLLISAVITTPLKCVF
jgi:hypothetical protein